MAGELTLDQQVVEFVAINAALQEKQAQQARALASKQAACDAMIPKIVEEMVRHERITPDQREKLATQLRDPERALAILLKTAGHRNNAEDISLGKPQISNEQPRVKRAAAIGGRRVTDADTAMLLAMGISPQE